MLGIIKNLRLGFGLLLTILVVSLVSYFSSQPNRGASFGKLLPVSSITSLPNDHAPRPPANPVSLDSDNDGIPDSAELNSFRERENFKRAFTGIAEMQFYLLSNEWNKEQRDCAGLVRFAWREALRRHDRAWFQKMGPGYEFLATDVSANYLDRGPIGEKLFRTDFGSYKPTDLAAAKFSEFADARTLKNFNSQFISRDRQFAQPGDLLFYHQPWVQKFPYHVMIFVGESPTATQAARGGWVVYHTGASAVDEGTVKKVQLSVLDQHPNKRWRPVESNPNFLGFYRLKILE
ncbi:MAG: DUF1175 domain-containing protein [Pyrinomonadaceae bacterium]|nr:DUF1175 domain-containing protein [Pyrinomonadaceae bacterium]